MPRFGSTSCFLVPGLKSGTLTALRAHLLTTKQEQARFAKLLDGGNPSVGGKLLVVERERDDGIVRCSAQE